jgi:diguanylate cyclase (GGDEF)-like protein
MSRTRRTITPLLIAQAATMVLTTGVAIAWMVQGIREWHASIELPRDAIRVVEQSVQDARIAPYDFLGTGDPAARSRGQRAAADASANLRVLDELLPGLTDPIEATQSALRMLEGASSRVWDQAASIEQLPTEVAANSPDPRTAAVALVAEADAELTGALAVLSKKVSSQIAQQPATSWLGMIGLWLLALSVYALTGFSARRRFIRGKQEADSELNDAIDGVTEALHAAKEGTTIPKIPDHPLVRPFAQIVDDVAQAMVKLHHTNQRIRRQFTFRHELVDALELAESEDEVVRTAVRAARVAFPDKRFQLMMEAPNDEYCTPIDEAAPTPCTLERTDSCPAVRKGCALYHHPDMGLARCPRIKADNTVLTCAPVSVNGQAVGVVQLVGDALDEGQTELLEALSGALGSRTGVVRDLAERALAAGTDPLTSLANRRSMDEHMRRLDNSGIPYVVIVADLDHFKNINDTYGHDVGDSCLQLFSGILQEVSRDSDLTARPGGEEFALILSGAGVDAGMAVASRIRAMLAQATRRHGPVFTASLGIAARPKHGDAAEEVLRAADVALYDAKDQGRDQCVAAMPMALEIVG